MKLRYIGLSTVREISSTDLFQAFGLESGDDVHVDKRVSDTFDVSAATAAVLLERMPDEFTVPAVRSLYIEPDRDEEGNMVPGTGNQTTPDALPAPEATELGTVSVDPERKTEDDTSLPSGDNHDEGEASVSTSSEAGAESTESVDSDSTKTKAESATSQPKSRRS